LVDELILKPGDEVAIAQFVFRVDVPKPIDPSIRSDPSPIEPPLYPGSEEDFRPLID
jgi:hypothetical protein